MPADPRANTVGHKTHGGYRGKGFWIGMVGGHATSMQLLQNFVSPRPLKELVVTAEVSADAKNLGGHAVIQVGPRGEEPKGQIASTGLHHGPLSVKIDADELDDLKEFDVRAVLRSTSGVEQGTKACAALHSLRVEGR